MPSPQDLQPYKRRQAFRQCFQGRFIQMQHHQVCQQSQLGRSLLHAAPQTEVQQLQASQARQERKVVCLQARRENGGGLGW